MSVLLQAGGEGTRLRPATDKVPKPMLLVGGVPIIERLLRHVVQHGLRDITIVTRHLAEVIEEHVGGLELDARIAFVRERRPLGNAGALRLLPDDGSTVVMAFADLLTDLDLSALLAFHRRSGGDLTLASHWDPHRLQFGELVVDGDRVLGYDEKPVKRFLVCSGIVVVGPRVVELARRHESGPVGVSDLANNAIAAGCTVVHWEHEARWFDINSIELLRAVDEAVRSEEAGAAGM